MVWYVIWQDILTNRSWSEELMKRYLAFGIFCIHLFMSIPAVAANAFWIGNSFSMNLPGVLAHMWSHASPVLDLTVTCRNRSVRPLGHAWEVLSNLTPTVVRHAVRQSNVPYR
jgi:hypothetical protein